MKIIPNTGLIKHRRNYKIGDLIKFKYKAFGNTHLTELLGYNNKIVKIIDICQDSTIDIGFENSIHWGYFETLDDII